MKGELKLLDLGDGETELVASNILQSESLEGEPILKKSLASAVASLAPKQSMMASEHKALAAILFEIQSYQSMMFDSPDDFHRIIGNNTLLVRIPLWRWDILTGNQGNRNTQNKKEILSRLSHKQFIWDEDINNDDSDCENLNLFLSTGISDRHVTIRIPPKTRKSLILKSAEPSFNLNILTMSSTFSKKYDIPLYELICQYIDIASTERQQASFQISLDTLLMRLRVQYEKSTVNGRTRIKFLLNDISPSNVKRKILTPAIENVCNEGIGLSCVVDYFKSSDKSVIFTFKVDYNPPQNKELNDFTREFAEEVLYVKKCLATYSLKSTAVRLDVESRYLNNQRDLLFIYDCWMRATAKPNKIKSPAAYFVTCYEKNWEAFCADYQNILHFREQQIAKKREENAQIINKQNAKSEKLAEDAQLLVALHNLSKRTPAEKEAILAELKEWLVLKEYSLHGTSSVSSLDEILEYEGGLANSMLRQFVREHEKYFQASDQEIKRRAQGGDIDITLGSYTRLEYDEDGIKEAELIDVN